MRFLGEKFLPNSRIPYGWNIPRFFGRGEENSRGFYSWFNHCCFDLTSFSNFVISLFIRGETLVKVSFLFFQFSSSRVFKVSRKIENGGWFVFLILPFREAICFLERDYFWKISERSFQSCGYPEWLFICPPPSVLHCSPRKCRF